MSQLKNCPVHFRYGATTTNHGATVDLPVLKPTLAIGSRVSFWLSTKKSFFTGQFEFRHFEGEVVKVLPPSSPWRQKARVKCRNQEVVLPISELTLLP